jgi:hypothetical protein
LYAGTPECGPGWLSAWSHYRNVAPDSAAVVNPPAHTLEILICYSPEAATVQWFHLDEACGQSGSAFFCRGIIDNASGAAGVPDTEVETS